MKAPAGGLEPPAVVAEGRDEALAVFFVHDLRRDRAELGRIVADIVIAGQVAAGHRQRLMQRLGEGEVVGRGRPVEGEVAAIDHEIGPGRVDMVPDRIEIRGELGQAAGEMGVGDLGQAELGHH